MCKPHLSNRLWVDRSLVGATTYTGHVTPDPHTDTLGCLHHSLKALQGLSNAAVDVLLAEGF